MKSLSSWWAGSSHRALGATTDKATRLALALTPVRSVIRVIDDHVPPMSVEWAAVHDGRSISASDFTHGRIVINPLPIIEEKIGMAEALDVVSGFAMHEASHGKHSRDRYRYLLTDKTVPSQTGSAGRTVETPAFRPMRIAAYLWNVVEDVRIEAESIKDWPGTRPYFDAVLGYMWSNRNEEPIADDNPHPGLVHRLHIVYDAVRYPSKIAARRDHYTHLTESLLAEGKLSAPIDFDTEVAWWQAWQADYLSDTVDTPTTIQRGLDRLAEDERVGQSMNEMTGEEKAEELAGEKIRTQLERLMREGVKGASMICINENGDIEVLDEETATRVEQLMREGLIEQRSTVFANGASNPPNFIRKPEETTESRRKYVGKPNAESAALRSSLVFRAAAPQFDVKLLRTGVMDDEELYRWGMGDYRVFSERIVEAKPDVYMGLLVDMSGSMSGSKLHTAQRLAQLFVWAMRDEEGVDTQVWGHTGDSSGAGASVDIFRLWEKGDPLTRLGLIDILPHYNNYDGHAISFVVKQVMEQPHPQKVVMVLSDGLPSGQGYGGERGMKHMRQVCEWAKRNGVNVLQIAIDDGIDPADQSRMFGEGNWFEYKNTALLPKQLTKVMSRYI
jgi:hypothetical protein